MANLTFEEASEIAIERHGGTTGFLEFIAERLNKHEGTEFTSKEIKHMLLVLDLSLDFITDTVEREAYKVMWELEKEKGNNLSLEDIKLNYLLSNELDSVEIRHSLWQLQELLSSLGSPKKRKRLATETSF